MVLGVLDLVDDGNGEVSTRNGGRAIPVEQRDLVTDLVFTGALAGCERSVVCRRAEEDPVEFARRRFDEHLAGGLALQDFICELGWEVAVGEARGIRRGTQRAEA